MTLASPARPKALLGQGGPLCCSGHILGTDTQQNTQVGLSEGSLTDRTNEERIQLHLSPKLSRLCCGPTEDANQSSHVCSVWHVISGAGWSLNPSSAASELCDVEEVAQPLWA